MLYQLPVRTLHTRIQMRPCNIYAHSENKIDYENKYSADPN